MEIHQRGCGVSFKIGELCILIGGVKRPGDVSLVGCECTVVSGLHFIEHSDGDSYFGHTIEIHGHRSPHSTGLWSVRPEWLKRKDEPSNYDGNLAGDWDLCPWQPNKQRVRVT
jgi:hypothetical protein